MPDSDIQHRTIFLLKMLGVAALYALIARLAIAYSTSGFVTLIWPTSGLALAVLLIGGRRYAWGVFLGAFLAYTMLGKPFGVSVAIASGNTLETLFGAWLLTRDINFAPTIKFDPAFRSLRDYLRLIILAGGVGSCIAALTGVTALLFSGFITSKIYFRELLQWWMGDVLGIILITPLILVCWQKRNDLAGAKRIAEAVLLLGLTFVAGQVVFFDWFNDSVGHVAKGYWLFLFMVWIAVRLGTRGTMIAMNMMAVQALLGAYHEIGFFADDIAQTRLANYWLYMVTQSVIGMALATHFTERKLTEEALRTNEASLRAILNNSPYLVWLKDAEGRYVHINRAYVDSARLKDDQQVIGKTDFDLWPKELAEKYRFDDAEAMALRQQRHIEEPSFDGNKMYWMETFKTPVIDEKGNVLGITGFARDITERKQAEDTLRKLSTAVEQSPSSVVITDLDANIEYVNQAFVRETGYSLDEAVGQNPRLLNSGKNPEVAYREMWTCLALGEVWKGELINRRKDGSEYIESVLISPVKQADGQVTHYLAIKENITKRKSNEAQIERLSRAYRLLSRVNEAIVRSQDRYELFAAICNAAIESELFRLIWIGILDETWVIPVTYAGVEEGYTDNLSILLDDERTGNGPTGRAIREGAYVVCQDIEHDPSMAPWRDETMKRGYLASAAFPISEAGGDAGAITVYAAEAHFFTSDITQLMMELAADVSFALDAFAEKKHREQAENEIRQLNIELEYRVSERTHQLEVANKELEAFSYSVSHDLRTPLRSIDGFSRVLSKNYYAQLDATGKDWLERVCRASQHMGRLIDDMLKLSQVTRGTLKRELVDLSKIAENLVDGLSKINPERQIRVTLQQGLSAQADYGLLRIVMDNLLGNAFKFTGKKPDAEIEFGAHDIDGERAFFVRDNGDGFNMEYAHKLFGAFQRLHTTSEFEGTGIGLATVQRVIYRHNGKLWAEAIEGQGATFYFTLPQETHET